jgi:hypothetical protein
MKYFEELLKSEKSKINVEFRLFVRCIQVSLITPEPSYKKNGVAHMVELLVADRLALN